MPTRFVLTLTTSLGLALSAVPAHASVNLAMPSPAAASTSGPLSAALVGETLSITWAPQNGDRVAVFDEHHGKFIYRDHGLSTSLPIPSGESAALTVYRVGGQDAEVLGRVQAMRPVTGSSLGEVVSITTSKATSVGLGASQAREPWQVDAVGLLTQVVDLADTTVPLALGSHKQITLTSSTLKDGESLFLSQGLRLSAPLTYAQAEATDDGAVPAGVVTNRLTQMFYDTFIPTQYIDAPDSDFIPMDCESGDGSNYVYGGDGIADQMNSNKFRTRAKTSWHWGVRSQGAAKWVNPTRRYIKDGDTYTFESQRQASDRDITVQNLANSGVEGRGAVQHAIGNPYCSAKNNIDYYNSHTFYRTGGYSTKGKHDRMPHHKHYRYDKRSDGTERYESIFLHRLKDAKCLNVYYEATACNATEYQYSK